MSDTNPPASDSAKDANAPIAAVDFQPIDSTTPSRTNFVKPAVVVIGLALLASAAVLWFLLTAKSLIVETDPAQAELSIEGGLVFSISGNYLLRPGDYSIAVKAEGYFDLQESFTVSDADSQRLTLSLEKKPGHLALTSEPQGAQVTVDGEVVGVTPLTIAELSPGEHVLNLAADRYFPLEQGVVVEGLDKTQTLDLSLMPAWGDLVISSQPAGAVVTVNGEERGVTPLTTELLEQGEKVALKLPGYKRWKRTLSVEAGGELDYETVNLQPADGLVTVVSQPAGASITVNGTFRGTTPAELQLQPGQTHQVSLFLDGFQTASRTLQLESGQERQLSVNLSATLGSIRIIASPEDAEVWIDGALRGRSGTTFQLPAKAHQVSIRKTGYATKNQTITPRPGVEQVLQIQLLTERAARWANTPRQITTKAGQQLALFKPEQTFTMGASRRESGRRSNEVLRKVRLERAFYFGLTEVTNKQFNAFQSKHTSSHANGQTLDTPDQPAVSISWEQAALYCNWLSEQEGLPLFYQVEDEKVIGFNQDATGYRLPTEAEWSWASRFRKQSTNSGIMMKYGWEGVFPPTGKVGNFADVSAAKIVGRVVKTYEDGYAVSAPVARFMPNDKGLFDLEGNVSEWINDYYGIQMSLSDKADVDPVGPEKGEFRVLRGASWRHGSLVELRLSYRDYHLDGRDDIGFRVARYAE